MENKDELEKDETRVYELGYLILPSVSEEKLPEAVGSVKKILADAGAVIISEDYPKARPLAYTVEKAIQGEYRRYSSAYFGWVKFDGQVLSVNALEHTLRKTDNILRFILVKTVRENTMTPSKPLYAMRPHPIKPTSSWTPGVLVKPAVEGPAMTSAELDKTIEELVID